MKNNCINITIYDFIECHFNNNFTPLLESGEIEPENEQQKKEIAEAWNLIIEEFAILTGSWQHSELLNLMNDQYRLVYLLYRTSAALLTLQCKYSANAVKTLQDIGYPVVFTQETYKKDFEIVVSRSKGLKIELETVVNKLNELQKVNKSDQSEADFMENVAIIQSNLMININIMTVSLYEYAGFVRANNKMAVKRKGDQT